MPFALPYTPKLPLFEVAALKDSPESVISRPTGRCATVSSHWRGPFFAQLTYTVIIALITMIPHSSATTVGMATFADDLSLRITGITHAPLGRFQT